MVYVGLTLIGRIVGFSELSASLSTVMAAMVGGGAGERTNDQLTIII